MKLSNELEYADGEEYQMALTTARLENEYDKAYARTRQLLDTERGRMHCMERLLLRIENENLRLQVNRAGLELIQARKAEFDTRQQLQDAIREFDRLQDVTQTSSRELENLRQELASMNTVASDTQKLQAEKVRLAKEMSSIQTEVERLRVQNSSVSELLTEKQAIDRQLNTVELELENEKRAHERALAKQSQQAAEIAALTSKLEEARQDLKLAHRRSQEELQQKGCALTSHRSPVFSKGKGVDEITQVTQNRQGETPVQQQESWVSNTTKVPVERPDGIHPKKLTSRLHSELTIATPGAVRAKNQQKRAATLPGEKSSFSITPFLNRTTGLEESSTSSDDELNESYLAVKDERNNDVAAATGQAKAETVKQSLKPAKKAPTKPRKEEKQKLLDTPDGVGDYQVPLARPAAQKQPLAKKRKLGVQRDRGLFDGEEEDDNTLHDSRRPGKKLVAKGPANIAGTRVFAAPVGFSPLKRDRKRF
ncbi:hypothetical protein BDV18DRAFT_149278 [Aspergillus unguis]